METGKLKSMLNAWLEEDIGHGDLTSESIVPVSLRSSGVIHAKAAGVIAGLDLAAEVFRLLDPEIDFRSRVKDGDAVAAGTVLAEVYGSARALLSGERLALNLLQHLSGIATKTAAWQKELAGTQTKLTDTRKTLPGLRQLQKYAVRVGGGSNHRFGLYDGVLIKDNHIKLAGGIAEAIQAARERAPHTIKIEVEVETLDGVEEALAAGADIIMLDNMEIETMRQAVALNRGRVLLEASGGIDGKKLAQVAATGVDLISAGALTHSVTGLDISLDIGEAKGGR
ncbi:carboxylating nicotinate-nucleotide diphosphorylase [Azotosporobacter soli]|uniref:carboxylating nicotinate-nucleotide diphosphorylase n=1 Tax=Azotosporobacter soli TaxID=3055040 RepID=UPI0031FE7707